MPPSTGYLHAYGELARLGLEIWDVHGHSVDSGAPRHRRPVEVSLLSDQRTDRAMMRHDAQPPPHGQEDDTVEGAADTRGRLRDRLEHRLEIRGRAADDAKHVAGRFLALQAFC